jgi:catechol 2,3-dioxygenase-like lactoylglutathione lyase family enzyme
MLDHMTFRVRDIDAARSFYAAVLRPLGYTLVFDQVFGSEAIIGFGDQSAGQGRIDTWFVSGPSPHGGPPATTGCHLCWTAPSRAAVDAFHAAALAAGARDNGPPGLRPHYHPHYYGAFAIDAEGNNIEAACHLPE